MHLPTVHEVMQKLILSQMSSSSGFALTSRLSEMRHFLQVITLMAFMLAVVFVFEISGVEIESITHKEGIIGATRDLEAGAAGVHAANGGQGYNVNLPPRATENGQSLSDVYAEVTATPL